MRKGATWILAAVLAIAACGGGGATGDGPEPGGRPDGIVAMLELIPNTADNRAFVEIEDLALIRSGASIELPSDPTDEDQLASYVMEVTQGPGPFDARRPLLRAGLFLQAVGAPAIADLPLWRTAMGVGLTDLDGDALAGRPPDQLIVWRGAVEPNAVATAVQSDPDWSADLRELSHAGISYWCWTDDPAAFDPERRSPMRPLGRGGCLAAFDGEAYRTITPEAMEAALEVRAGDAASLADHVPLRLAADALDREGPYLAHLTDDAASYAADRIPVDTGQDAFLDEWQAMGIGAGFDPDTLQEYLVLVLVFPDEATAAANATILEETIRSGRQAIGGGRPWSEMIEGEVSVRSDDRAVVAVLEGASISAAWINIANVPDTLTAWE